MRIINPKKSSGSSGITVNESGDSSFELQKQSKANKFANLKESIAQSDDINSKKTDKEAQKKSETNRTYKVKKQNQPKKAIKRSSSGTVISANDLPEEVSKKEYSYLYQRGIHLLSMREHSVKEVTTKLSVKSERLDLVTAVVDELIAKDYLSNSRFTESYVRAKQQRGFGPTKIRNELSNKDIKNSMIDRYLNAGSAVWYENAENQYTKKYGDEPISDYNSWTKRARFMQSRGFTMEHIHSTLPPVDSD